MIDDGVGDPDPGARRRIERVQPAIDGSDIHPAFPHRDTSIDEIATRMSGSEMGRLGVITPDLLSCRRIHGVHVAPGSGGVHHAIDDDRRGLLAAIGAQIVLPGKSQLADVPRC